MEEIRENCGSYDPELECYSWDINIYYDDIDHTQLLHHAYALRFFEHAREHMISKEFLPALLESDNIILVAVKTEQKHTSYSIPRIGDVLNIRTKVQVEGKYRIRFLHEAWRRREGIYAGTTEEISSPVLTIKGFVEMACLDASSFKLVTLPERVLKELRIIPNQDDKAKKPLHKPSKLDDFPSAFQYECSVSDFDTDFTRVVYQAKYLQYYETARMELFRGINGLLDMLKSSGCFLTTYKAELNFKSPALPYDQLRITTAPKLDGKYRIIFKQMLFRKEEDSEIPLNSAVIELICLSEGSHEMKPIPEDVINLLGDFLKQAHIKSEKPMR